MQYVLYLFLLVFLFGCGDENESRQTVVTAVIKKPHYVILGPISGAHVSLTDIETNVTKAFATTKILSSNTNILHWGSYNVGSFENSTTLSIEDGKWYLLTASGGIDVDPNDDGIISNTALLDGKMYLYCKGKDIKSEQLVINVFTTIAALFYMQDTNSQTIENFLNDFSKKMFHQSINDDAIIDYKDLFSYIPNYTNRTNLLEPSLYENLLNYGFMDALLANKDLVQLLNSDSDDDGLSFWEEMLHATSPALQDSDGDTILDAKEIFLGLSANSVDSDKDGLSDNEELNIYGTSPLNSDSDGDYLPDGNEVFQNSDPLNADEDNDGVLDGLEGDPFFKYQWYLISLGDVVANTANVSTIVGNDLDILDVYHQTLGDTNNISTIVQVVDSGVEAAHEDIDVDLELSFNAVTKGKDPTPVSRVTSNPESPLDVGHGTAVAGIIAAKMGNGLGIRGVVPHAKIAGSNWLENQTLGEIDRVWFSGINSDKIGVCNNSWGAYMFKDDSYEQILAKATSDLRNGKGRIFTFAAGNFRETYGNANLSYISNNPYVITVAALNDEDKFASYSNPGSNILVSAYGGEHYYNGPTIMTTMLSGTSYHESDLNGVKGVITVDEDTKKNYSYVMNGTSAATPMVSGAIALTLGMCPKLSYRDVKWLIANTATKVDPKNLSWVQNAAGLWHSIDYGYGKINTKKMIELCSSKYFKPLGTLQRASVNVDNIDKVIPDNNTTISQNISFTQDLQIEWVGVTIDTDHPFAGDLEISLVSPSGTRTILIQPTELHYAAYNGGFRFSSVAFIDERSQGVWKVELIDRLAGDSGVLKNINLEVYGHKK